jgi:hypothetical protein
VEAVSTNPNPSRITGAIWSIWGWFDQLEPTAALGGVFAPKGGYHDIRNGHGGDYSVAEVSTDREGPGDKASAIDLTMSAAAMRKYTTRLDDAAKRRDERLYIGGQAIIREFIGTKDSARVYCYVLVGGRARGLGADASEDWGRDSTHLWHIHISIIRKFCASTDMADRLYSVLNGEPLSAWKARRAPAPAAPTQQEEDMSFQVIPIPTGFAYDEDGEWIEGNESGLSIPLPPAGFSGAHASWKDKRVALSFSGDHANPGQVVRVAVQNGAGWNVTEDFVVTSGPRVSLALPAAAGAQGYNITVGRKTTDVAEHATLPLSVLVEIV